MVKSCWVCARSLLAGALSLLAGMGTLHAQDPDPDYQISIGEEFGVIGETAEIPLLLDFPDAEDALSGWSLGICHGSAVEIQAVADGSTLQGLAPSFRGVNLYPGEGWTVGVVIDFTGAHVLAPGKGYEIHRATYSLLEVGSANIDYCGGLGPIESVRLTLGDATEIEPVMAGGKIDIGTVPTFQLFAGNAEVAAGEQSAISVRLSSLKEIEAFSFGLAHDGELVEPDSVTAGEAIASMNGGAGPGFFHADLAPTGGSGVTVQCVLSLASPFQTLEPGTDLELARLTYQALSPPGGASSSALSFVDGFGTPAVPIVCTSEGASQIPVVENGSIAVEGSLAVEFQRGDFDSNGAANLLDALQLLSWLFGKGTSSACQDRADLDDNGELSILDPIFLLNHLFLNGEAIPAPAEECGEDTTIDGLECVLDGNC